MYKVICMNVFQESVLLKVLRLEEVEQERFDETNDNFLRKSN